jgi:hypothetical protein
MTKPSAAGAIIAPRLALLRARRRGGADGVLVLNVPLHRREYPSYG